MSKGSPTTLRERLTISLWDAHHMPSGSPHLTRWEAYCISKGSPLASPWAVLHVVAGGPSHTLGWPNDFYLGGLQLINQHLYQSTLYNFTIVVRHDIFCKTMTNKNTTPDMMTIYSVL